LIEGLWKWDSTVSNENDSPDAPSGVGQDTGFESDRTSERRRVLKGARIGFNHEYSSVECVIRNISETGAFITVEDGILVPNQFTLFNELDRFKVDCEIVWRHGNAFGAHFCGDKVPIASTRAQVLSHYTPEGNDAEDDHNADQSDVQQPRYGPTHKPVFGKRK